MIKIVNRLTKNVQSWEITVMGQIVCIIVVNVTNMKFSQFNSILPLNNQFCLYNSFTQKVVFILPELKDLLEAAKNEGIRGLESYHPTFYHYLISEGFIVPKELDEIEKVKQLSKQVDENENSFILTINPTMNCNFKCWYCYETHQKDSRINDETLIKMKKFISNISLRPNLDEFSLSFFGGEPLLYFKQSVKPVVNHFVDTCVDKGLKFDVSFTTNGYLINQDFIDFFKSKDIKCALQITLDGYKSEHDAVRNVNSQKGSYAEIIANIKLLVRNHFFVRIRINYTNSNIKNSHLISNDFSDLPQDLIDSYIMFDFHKVWQEFEEKATENTLEETLSVFTSKGINATTNLSPNNVLHSCYADKRNSVVINYNGEIYKCTARDFTHENREGYIDLEGNIIWDADNLERRMNVKFKNKPCLECRILPLCNGGCSQHALEHLGEEYCIYGGDEDQKDRVVRTKIDEIIGIKPNVSIPKLMEVSNEN